MCAGRAYPRPIPQRRFPRPWRFEPIPGGYRVIDANGLALAHVYGQPPDAVAFSDRRLTDDKAERIARLIVRLPELVVMERDRNKPKSRRRSPLPHRPVTLADLAMDSRSNARPVGEDLAMTAMAATKRGAPGRRTGALEPPLERNSLAGRGVWRGCRTRSVRGGIGAGMVPVQTRQWKRW